MIWLQMTKQSLILKRIPTTIQRKTRSIELSGPDGCLILKYKINQDAVTDYRNIWTGLQSGRACMEVHCDGYELKDPPPLLAFPTAPSYPDGGSLPDRGEIVVMYQDVEETTIA